MPASCQQKLFSVLCSIQDVPLEGCIVHSDLHVVCSIMLYLCPDSRAPLTDLTFLYFWLSEFCKILSSICISLLTHTSSLEWLCILKSIIWLWISFTSLSCLSFSAGSGSSVAQEGLVCSEVMTTARSLTDRLDPGLVRTPHSDGADNRPNDPFDPFDKKIVTCTKSSRRNNSIRPCGMTTNSSGYAGYIQTGPSQYGLFTA